LPVRVLETPSDIEKQRDLWNSWPGTRDSDLDFFLFIAGIRSEVLSPHVLLAYRGETPDAMLAGRLEERTIPIKFGYINLRSPRIRVLDLIDGGLRGDATYENVGVLVGHILKSLRQGKIDLAIFEHLRVDSLLYQVVHKLSRGVERGVPRGRTTHRYLELPENSEELYKLLPPEHRQNYRRKGRKLLKDFSGDVGIKCYNSSCDLDLIFREIETIARKTYQRGLGFGFADTPEMRGRFELAASKGWLRVFILYVAGKPVAYWTATAYSGMLCGDQIGYDPEFRRYSPGMYLSLATIGDMCDHRENHNISKVDYGIGDAEYKSLLSNRCYEEEDVLIYGHTLRGIGINTISTPVFLADRFAKRMLAKSKLLVRAKRLWRDRAVRAQGQKVTSDKQGPEAES
jgi:hypothetical protein